MVPPLFAFRSGRVSRGGAQRPNSQSKKPFFFSAGLLAEDEADAPAAVA